MQDYPTIARMPGADDPLSVDTFEPGEVAGMRSAGWILCVSAFMGLLAAMLNPFLIIGSIIDVFLGVQLLRLRHSWRAWALVRAWVTLGIAALTLIGGAAGGGALVAIAMGFGQGAYSASLLLLLLGVPTMRRVVAGRIVFGLSVSFMILGVIIAVVAAALGHVNTPQG